MGSVFDPDIPKPPKPKKKVPKPKKKQKKPPKFKKSNKSNRQKNQGIRKLTIPMGSGSGKSGINIPK